jgi:diguanylate cyclase (GGDEF)-like protein/PAS domain S-box-containing protein
MKDEVMNNERIVIVEDEKIIALDLQRRLERFGYQVVGMASDGPEAIEAAADRNPDIILMDIMLAGVMDGIEAAKMIRERFAIPVIFLTAYTDEKTLERAKEVEPFGYILKPFKERELYTTIDIALYKNSIEKRLRKQEQLFSAILHSINDAIVATEVDLSVSFMNPAAEALIGCTEAQAKGRKVADLISPVDTRDDHGLFTLGPEDERPIFFSDTLLRNSIGQNVITDGSITRIREQKNATDGYVVTLRDITELKRLSETISYQASHDILTGLSNREEFSFKLNEILKSVRNTDDRQALLVIDVDRFKAVNDACGALAGDELLRQVASHIQANIARRDISARIGGDEFAVILRDCEVDNAISVAHRLQAAVSARKFVWQNGVFPVTLAIGCVPLTRDSEDTHAVLASADDACHLAKEEGGNKISVFSPEDSKFRKRRDDMGWIAKINRAVDENRFVLYHQPIVPLDEHAGFAAKAEVLIRLVNEDGSIASPGDFIPAAERYNLMPLIDRWVVRNSLRAYRTLMDRKSAVADGIISINLSGPSLLDESLIEVILEETREDRVDSSRICFEITETAAIQNLSYASRFMKKLKDEGFTFSLDDFGSGFSSFSYLRNLPVDYLKIDGSFVQSIDESEISYAMVESINSIGHVMGIKTIAEFVKSAEIKRRLIEIGVDYAQGYEIAKPSPLL